MYNIAIKEKFSCPPAELFSKAAVDYEGAEKFMPNIEKIDILSKETLEDGVEKITARFHARSVIPEIARPLLKPEMLTWMEEIWCDSKNLTIKWNVISDYMPDNVHCGGETRISEHDGGSLLEISGVLDIKPAPLFGAPEFIVKKVIEVVEPFIGGMIRQNVRRYFIKVLSAGRP